MNAHLWHGGTANHSSAPRLAMHAFYCRDDKPQQQYQKQLLHRRCAESARSCAHRALDNILKGVTSHAQVRAGS